jgi:hypothetical protein
MKKTPKKDTQPLGNDIPQMPFNEALKRVWAAKPKHKKKEGHAARGKGVVNKKR